MVQIDSTSQLFYKATMYLKKLKNFGSTTIDFVKNVANDERIPARDKKVLLALLALIISPVDIIPDWIPIFGMMDDIILLAIVLDYLFETLDQDILLSHYPWDMKSYTRLRGVARVIGKLTPAYVKDLIWKYEGNPYKG